MKTERQKIKRTRWGVVEDGQPQPWSTGDSYFTRPTLGDAPDWERLRAMGRITHGHCQAGPTDLRGWMPRSSDVHCYQSGEGPEGKTFIVIGGLGMTVVRQLRLPGLEDFS